MEGKKGAWGRARVERPPLGDVNCLCVTWKNLPWVAGVERRLDLIITYWRGGLAVWPWVSHLTSLSLQSFIYKMGTHRFAVKIPWANMYLVDRTMPNPTVNPLYIGAIITHHWHLELCFSSAQTPYPGRSKPASAPFSLGNALSTVTKQRKLVSHPCWWCRTQQHPLPSPLPADLPPPTVWHQRRTWQMAARVWKGAFFFFFKQCFPETCSSPNLLLGARQMVLECWLPSCSLCSQRRGAKWHPGSVSSDGVTLKFTQLQLWGQLPLAFILF